MCYQLRVGDVVDTWAVFVLEQHSMPWSVTSRPSWQWQDVLLSRVGQSSQYSQ